MPSITVMAPTAEERSRPPVPMAWVTPSPRRSMMQVTSWMPVPEAPTMPILPAFTTFVKAMGMELMMPVPQSGPMSMRPFSCAFRLRRTSSSRLMLSVNEKTLRPRSSARSISGAVYSPGVENRARLASGSASIASSQDSTSASWEASFLTERSERKRSVSARTPFTVSSLSESMTMTMSEGDAAAASSVRRPAPLKMSLLASVPIMT